MSIKKPFYIKSFDEGTVNQNNQNIETLYSTKLESRYLREPSGVNSFIYQSQEFGNFQVSANGSADVVTTFALAEKQDKIIFVNAHAQSILFNAAVTDITKTSVSITVGPFTTAIFSAVQTQAVSVWFHVVGSNP